MRATLALLLLLSAPANAAVSLSASSVEVGNRGEAARVCVALATRGEDVAGTQNDLVWDGDCATLADDSSCSAAGTHSKELHGRLLAVRDFTYRALILSFTDVDPIDDGILYCCDFVAETAPGTCCPIAVVNSQAATPNGDTIFTFATRGQVCVAPAGSTVASPTPTPTPMLHGDLTSSANSDGCTIEPPASNRRWSFPLLGALVLAVLSRRRTHRGRRRSIARE